MKNQSIYIDPEILRKRNQPKQQRLKRTRDQTLLKAPPQTESSLLSKPEHDDPFAVPEKQETKGQGLHEYPDNGLMEQRQATPNDPKDEMFGSRRQMQNDIKYTSAMKKDKSLKKDEAEEKVDKIAVRSDNVLIKMKTVFPFDLFPSTVTVDSNKVNIVDKTFFASETVTSILLEEITDVVIESNFFLAKLKITYSHHPLQPEHYSIPFLKKKEGLRAQEIIQGLLVLRISEGIDLSKLEPAEIVKHLESIGKTHENLQAAL